MTAIRVKWKNGGKKHEQDSLGKKITGLCNNDRNLGEWRQRGQNTATKKCGGNRHGEPWQGGVLAERRCTRYKTKTNKCDGSGHENEVAKSQSGWGGSGARKLQEWNSTKRMPTKMCK